MHTLKRLQAWYKDRCNGDWEHQWGVSIGTVDNPGWTVTIDLNETQQAEQSLETIDLSASETDWLYCWKEGTKFEGAGDPQKLEAIVEIFLKFVEY